VNADVYAREVEQGWGETVADAWEVLEPLRQVWRDGDRPVDFDDEYRDEAA
jgi:hypothetical protein